jgi:phosphoribosylglycinamide formyltransferase-1
MLRIGVLVSGGGTNLQAIIDNIEKGNIKGAEIVTVVSNVKDAYALQRAKNHHIENRVICDKEFKTKEEYEKELTAYLDEKQVQLIVLAGYMKILSKEFVKKYENKIINIHPSLIPAFCGKGYYGLKVHEEVLKRGVKITGATVHFVNEGADEGPIIIQKAVEVKKGDTPEILQKRVMEEAEWIIFSEAINMIIRGEV